MLCSRAARAFTTRSRLQARAIRRELVELDAALAKGGLTSEEEDHLDELAILTRECSAPAS
jgi:hypothetical protein